ncbi:MAG: nitroreductase family protein [Bacteriovoracaceae bacterium]|nr:nitroreductase family protein [Bacteriovoracaceae bacterium]
MEFETLKSTILATRTVHNFKEGVPIDPRDIEKALEVSLYAPNHKLTNPWHIFHVSDETRKRLSSLARELAREKGLDDEGQKKAMAKVMAPSALIVYALPINSQNKSQEREDYATLSCSIQLFALALRTLGFSYKWSTGGLSRHAQSYDLLGIDPHDFEIIGFIWVGKSLKEPILTKRPTLNEVVRHI